MFKLNVGRIDRVLRIILGLALIALVFVGPKTPLGWIGIVPLLTGLMRTCPLYTLIGLDTCQRQAIEAALARHHGQWARAARELEIDASNLHKLAKRLGMKA